jgi:hypothetical protein
VPVRGVRRLQSQAALGEAHRACVSDISEPGDIGGNPRKSCLFFLTVSAALKWDYPELRPNGRKSTSPYEVSGAFSTINEKPGERFIARQVVPITATGLQGE